MAGLKAKYDAAQYEGESYQYDINRKSALIQGLEKKYETGNFNRLLSENGEKLEYDAEGNRTAKGNIKYEWDHRNRLVKVVSPSETVEYTYDYQNRLVKRSIGKNITHFIHDGWQIVRQFENGKPVKRFLWGTKQDELLCDNDNWTLGDHLNTIREVVNSDGKVIAHCDYNAFGKRLNVAEGSLQFAYTGKLTDSATGLQWNINRWYDANAGRWISEDPIGFEGMDENLMRYVGNKVITLIDLYGLADCPDGTWKYSGRFWGGAVIAGQYTGNISMTCKKGRIPKKKIIQCDCFTVEQPYVEVQQATADMTVRSLGLSLGISWTTLWGEFWQAENLIDFKNEYIYSGGALGISAILIGWEDVWGENGLSGGGGISGGAKFSLAYQWVKVKITGRSFVYDQYIPLSKGLKKLMENANCDNGTVRQLGTPESINAPDSSTVWSSKQE